MNIKDKILLFVKGSSNGSKSSEPKVKKVREKKITRLQLILAGLVLIIVLVVFIVINAKISNKNKPYLEFEQTLVDAANNYYDINELNIKDGSTDRVDLSKLKSANLVNIDSNLVNKCDGYVESTSSKDVNTGEYNITRKAYIKCGSRYKTVNYTSY